MFHSQIYAGSHNQTIAEMAANLHLRLALFRRAQFRAPGRLQRSLAEHDAVVKAIVAADPQGAHTAMLHHVSLVEDTYEQSQAPPPRPDSRIPQGGERPVGVAG